MFKRVVWMGMGAVAGSASTVWAQRKVKTQLDKVSEKAKTEIQKLALDNNRTN